MTTCRPADGPGLQWPQASPGRGHALRARPSPALPPDSTPAAPGSALLRGWPGASTPLGKRSVACRRDRPRAAPPPARARLASAFRAAALLALALLAAPAYAQDTTPPSVSSITASAGGRIDIAYNEELDDASVPATTQFTVSIAGVSASVGVLSISDTTVMGVTTSTVHLALIGGIGPAPGETVKVSYAVPSANPLQDTSGNDAPAFSDQGLTTAVSWSTLTLQSAEAVRNAVVKLTFSAATATGQPDKARFTVTAGGSDRTPSNINYVCCVGSPAKGAMWLTVDPPIAKGDTVTVSYSATRSATQTGRRLRDASGNALQAFSGSTVTNNAAELIQSAVVVGDQLTLTYSGALNTTALPDKAQFSVRFGEDFGSRKVVSGISASGSTVTLSLRVSVPFFYGQAARIDYDDPQNNPLKDADGKIIDDLIRYPVTNNTPAAVERAEASGTSLALTYQGPLCTTTVAMVCTANTPGLGDFAVTVGGSARTVSAVAVEGSTVTLTLAGNAIGATDAVRVKYTQPMTNPLQDGNGNAPATFAFRSADNTSRLLVRNSLQSDGIVVNLSGDYAQAFTTGGSAFQLTRADVWMTNILSTTTAASWTLSIHESGSDGRPGTSLGSLAASSATPVPVGLPAGRIEHAASGTGIDLAANTTYFAVLDVSFGGVQNFVVAENSDAEDAGAAPGWSLANGYFTRNNAGTTWVEAQHSVSSVRIALHGRSTDETKPALQSLSVSGATLTLTYDETLDPGSVPAASAFAVDIDGGTAVNPTAVSVAGSAVTLTLPAAVTVGQTVTLAYTAPSASPLRDVAAPHYNNAETFAARNVPNNTPSQVVPTVSIASNGNITAGARASFRLTASPAPSSAISVNLTVTQTGGVLTPGSASVTIAANATSQTWVSGLTSSNNSGTVTVTLQPGTGYTPSTTASARTATVTVSAAGTDPPQQQDPQNPQDQSGGSEQRPRDPQPLQLALWTDKPGYRPGETVRLYRSLEPHDDRGRYRAFAWLERAGGGERQWLAPLSAEGELHAEAVDSRGQPASAASPQSLSATDRELAFEGQAPGPGLWQFVLELRPGEPSEQATEPAAPLRTRRTWAKFAVAERSVLLNRSGFDREIRSDLTLRADTLYYLGHQLFVHAGATLAIEPGTLLQAFGSHAAIIVEPGGRIVAEGTREAPVVLTCSAPAGYRQPGCWAGLRILGQAPVTRLEGVASGVLPPERPAYGGTDAEGSSGVLRYVRVEFAGASADPEAPGPAIGLYGAGSGTLLDHVQARSSLGDGFAFSGGTAACGHCVASGSGGAGLSWKRGWQGGASHLYVQHGRGGGDGLSGGHDPEGHDREPRSLPTLSNVTLVHSAPYDRRTRRAVAVRLADGSAVQLRDLLAAHFGGGALRASGRSRLLFGEGESSLAGALLWLNGSPQVPAGIAEDADFAVRNPKLRDVRDFAAPDPRPKADSPALTIEREGYIGAFGRSDNWLKEWTVFGPESVYDMRQRSEDEN